MRHATSTARSTRSSNIEGCEGYGSLGLVRTLRIRIMEEEATVSVLMACAHGMCSWHVLQHGAYGMCLRHAAPRVLDLAPEGGTCSDATMAW